MKLEVVTPEAVIYSGEVDSVTLPGVKGSFTLLTRHAPLISALGKGKVIIKGKESKEFDITGGFAEVNQDVVNVCLEEVIAVENEKD